MAPHLLQHLDDARVHRLGVGGAGLLVQAGGGVSGGGRRRGHDHGIQLDGRGGQVGPLGHDLPGHGAALRCDDQRDHARTVDALHEGVQLLLVHGLAHHDADLTAVERPRPADLGQHGGGLHVGRGLGRRGDGDAQAVRDLLGQSRVDRGEVGQLALADGLLVALAQLERVRLRHVLALHLGEGEEEQARLREVVVEGGGVRALLHRRRQRLRVLDERVVVRGGLVRQAAVERVGPVRRHAAMHGALVEAVTQHVVDRGVRAVDGQLGPVRPAEAGELRVQVGEEAALQERVVGDVDAGHEVGRVEGHLLRLREVVGRVGVQRHAAEGLHGGELLRDQLRGVEQVDALEHLLLVVLEHLHAELPLGEGAGLDRVGEVTPVEVRVHAVGEQRLLPGHGVHAEHRLPVELDQHGGAVRRDQAVGVDAEALHHAVGARDAAVGHVPQGVVLGLGVQGHEVPERVVRGLRLRDLAVRVRLHRVHHVRELDGVLHEEHGDVVAHQVPRALVRVELGGEAAGVAGQVHGAAGAGHGGEADEHLRLLVLGEESGPADLRGGAVAAEHAVGAGAAGVDHALGDALVVEVAELLPQVVVLQEGGAAAAGLERVVRVLQAHTVRGGQVRAALRGGRGVGAGVLAGGGDLCRTALVRGRDGHGLVRVGEGGVLLEVGGDRPRRAGDVGLLGGHRVCSCGVDVPRGAARIGGGRRRRPMRADVVPGPQRGGWPRR